jgi:signal transduction histidine kinase
MAKDLGLWKAADNLLAPGQPKRHSKPVTAPAPEPPAPLTALRHELRTPLAVVIGFADAMRERALGPLSEPYRECAEAIDKAARHMLELVDRMIDEGHGDSDSRTCDAAEAVADVVQMMQSRAEARGVALTTSRPGGAVMVEVDATHLKQIVINLVANAVTATPAGGRVKVMLERLENELILTVEDSGPGPASDRVDGVGLQLVRSLCAAYRGDFALGGGPDGARAVARLAVG